jgi:hypothetical protein
MAELPIHSGLAPAIGAITRTSSYLPGRWWAATPLQRTAKTHNNEQSRGQAPNPKENAMDTRDLVSVYTVSNPVEAEIIKNALKVEGIRAFVEGGNQAAETGLAGIAIHIEVPAGDADRARKFIEHHQPHKRKKE